MHETVAPSFYIIAAAVGLVAGLASGLLTFLVYGFEDLFSKLRVHWMWWPCIGGALVGVGGYFEPRALGVGYEIIDALLHGQIPQDQLLSLLSIKAVVWSIALGSGTSGGVLAPLLIIGASLGAIGSTYLHLPHPAVWPLVSMAALMGGTMRSPLTASIFAFELTYAAEALPPVFIASVIAYGVTVLLLKRSILTEKVARRGHHLVREYSVDPYDLVRVEDVMDKNSVALPSSMTISEFSERLAHGDKVVSSRYAYPLLDTDGQLAGIMTRADVVSAFENDPSGATPLQEAGTSELLVAFPDESVSHALRTMVIRDIGRLPVVARDNQKKIVGYLGRSQVIACRLLQIREEHLRETGLRNSA